MPNQLLPTIEQPSWLANLTNHEIMTGEFPLNNILQDSLYYPASEFDASPIRHFSGSFLSFIYVDYSTRRHDLLNQLETNGFIGYQILGQRSVLEKELKPIGTPTTPVVKNDLYKKVPDGIINNEPFCEWIVFERNSGFDDSHGPLRFSLIYLVADGVAAYTALYTSNKKVPKGIAIIQPGSDGGYLGGGNYTNFKAPDKIFSKYVHENPAGMPRYLLYGGNGGREFYRDVCWPEYSKHIGFVDKPPRGNIGVWEFHAGEEK